MRITKQPSGGRGEYELSEYAPNGLRPLDLIGLIIHLRFGSHTLKTDVLVPPNHPQGKYRLRRLGRIPQVQLQVASVLLLPKPIREEEQMGAGELVLQNNEYVIKNMHFGEVTYSAPDLFFTADLMTIDCMNKTIQTAQVPVTQRIARIEQIWARRTELPSTAASILEQHQALVESGGPMPTTAQGLVLQLQREVAAFTAELDEVAFAPTTDVVDALWAVLNAVPTEQPVLPDQIEPEQVEVRRREIEKWRAWVRRRGASSARFQKKVRVAYKSQCVMCGARFPKTDFNRQPGVDAAHILPWAQYELDTVRNGIALCKLHHWAFDQGILRIVPVGAGYQIVLDPVVRGVVPPEFSLDVLEQVVGLIPKARLPLNQQDWPDPQFLNRWNETSE